CGLGPFLYLLLREASQHPLRALEELRQLGARGRRVEAVRRAQLWIPELGISEAGSPRALHEADEAGLPLDRDLVATAAEHQHFCVRRNRRRRGATRERNLVLSFGDAVLLYRRHGGIGSLARLRPCLTTPAVRDGERQAEHPRWL